MRIPRAATSPAFSAASAMCCSPRSPAIAAVLVARSPPVLIEAVAGLALIGAFGGAMLNAVQDEDGRLPGLVTFLVTASGSVAVRHRLGVLGLVIGLAVHHVLRAGVRHMTEKPSLPQSVHGRPCRALSALPRRTPVFRLPHRAARIASACGLDYSRSPMPATGPAIFVILISGFIVVGAALIVEVVYQPPFWLHALLWGPLILVVTLLPLLRCSRAC